MKFSLPKCLHFVWAALLYLLLSSSLAFLCHRLYFYDSPAADAIKSVFAGSVFVVTLCGLIWWPAFRVFVFLLIPKLFNVNGRTVLIAYISFLTISGPMWNTKRNIGAMSSTLACAFHEIQSATRELWQLMKEPVVYIKNLIDTMEERTKKIFAQLAEDLREIEGLAQDLIKYFRSAIEFLKRLSSLCEDKLGSPMTYCMQMIRKTIEECEVDHDNTICSPLVSLYPLCTPLGALEIFCIELDYEFLDLHFVEYLEEGFKALLDELKLFVDVDIEIDVDFEVTTNKTKSYEKIRQDVAKEFADRTDEVLSFFSASQLVSTTLSLYLFYSVYSFRYNYLTKLHFQNRYLLRSLIEINELRVARGQPSVFPLNFAERRRFIVIYSWRVTYWEVIQALQSLLTDVGPCFYVFCVALGDYALYYLLVVITEESRGANMDVEPVIKVEIKGEGFAADFMHSLVDTFVPIVNGFQIDFGVCAPQPHQPDEERMVTLFLLCIFCLLQGILYPFAARFMHLIMEQYYEEETRQRMAWLYNDIIRRRRTLQMIVREKILGRYEGEEGADPIPVMEWVRSQLRDYSICRYLLLCLGDEDDEAGVGSKFCINCAKRLAARRSGRGEEEERKVGYFKCPAYECSGIYCGDCIRQLNWVCILCKKNVYVPAAAAAAAEEEVQEGVDVSAF